MERIQKALEQAEKQRGEQRAEQPAADAVVRPAAIPAVEPRPASAPDAAAQGGKRGSSNRMHYTRTRVIDIPKEQLRENRLIAAIPEHELCDAYRMLRTRVLQNLRSNNWNSLAITGPASGCGKTLTAINLAISLAMEVSQTVLLVDLDLRKPSVHTYFGVKPELGISDYLFDEVQVADIMFSPGIDRLVVLPGRESVHNSSEMLRSPKMLALVDELKGRYPDRIVVVDLPPILAADDALAFSPYIDAMLLVAENGATRKEHLQKAVEVLKGRNIIGTVLNKSMNSDAGLGSYRSPDTAVRSQG